MRKPIALALAALPLAVCAALAAESPNQLKQCVIGPVAFKMDFSFKSKRCYLAQDESKLRANLEVLGWKGEQHPKLDWAKEVAVVDVGDIPYATAVPACEGVFAEAGNKATLVKWKWREHVVPSTASARSAPKPAPVNDERSIKEKVKEEFANYPTEAKEKLNAIGEDFKKFPSPMPKRYAVIAIFPKHVLAKAPSVKCLVEK